MNAPHTLNSGVTARKAGGYTALVSRKGLICLLHPIKSGGLGLLLERIEYYSNPHLR